MFALVGLTGLEPVTLRLSSACSNQLSYRPIVVSLKDNVLKLPLRTGSLLMVELGRIELPTFSLQSYRSTN